MPIGAGVKRARTTVAGNLASYHFFLVRAHTSSPGAGGTRFGARLSFVGVLERFLESGHTLFFFSVSRRSLPRAPSSLVAPSLRPVLACPPSLLHIMRPLFVALLALVACVCTVSAVSSAPYTRSFDSFSALRAATPSSTGELVYLISHISGLYKGGGMFVGNLTKGTDDGGMTASAGTAYHWTRAFEDFETLNVLHFGAYHDGTHDDHDAVMSMWKWSAAQSADRARNGIRLVEGVIHLSAFDISSSNVTDFAIYGPTSPYGVRPLVTITSDKTSTPAFSVCAQRVVIRGVGFDGGVTGTVNSKLVPQSQSNKQGFFKNIFKGSSSGQTIHVFGIQATNVGGHIFDLINLYQSKFDQVYATTVYGNVWNLAYTGADGTYWDHHRSVEIANVNVQKIYGTPGVINAPRVEQGNLRNLWIEDSRAAGDLSSGQWVIDAVNAENVITPLIMTGTRDITRQLNAAVTRGTDVDKWLSEEDAGWIREDAYGIFANAPTTALWEGSMLRGINTSDSAVWLEVGTFQTQQVGGLWEIEVLSKLGVSPATGVRPTSNGAPGITRISLQRGSGATPIVSFTNEGSSGVTAVRYNGNYDVFTNIFVQLDPTVYEYGVFARSSGITRFEASSAWNMFSVSGDISSKAPTASVLVVGKASIHNGEAGIGVEGDMVTIDTITVASTTVNATQLAGYMIQKINGIDYAVPYYEAPESYPLDPPTPPALIGTPASTPTGAASSVVVSTGLLCALLLCTLAVLF